jgi:hypothetical protein
MCSQKRTNIGNDQYDSQLLAVITGGAKNEREGRKERNNSIYDYLRQKRLNRDIESGFNRWR